VAEHWSAAGELAPALSASVAAGDAAREVLAVAEALDQYQRALDLWDRVANPETVAGVARSALLESAADVASGAGEHDLAIRHLDAAIAELGSHPERFDPAEGVLRSWLVAQAHARAVHITRSHDAHRRQDRAARTEHTPPSAEVEIAVHARALTEEGRRAVDQLVPGEREAILLAYFGGHTISETARLLGALEDTVKNHLRSGLRNLRRALEVEGVTT
jgi:RNA polymerase sigma factor (sigma-70 family)